MKRFFTTKRIGFLLASITTLYVAGGIFIYLMQERITFPVPDRPFAPCEELYHAEIITHGETRMYHRHRKDSDTVVIFYHGNGNVICDVAFITRVFDEVNVSYIFPEYDGYGGDKKKPSSTAIKRNVADVVDYIVRSSSVVYNSFG